MFGYRYGAVMEGVGEGKSPNRTLCSCTHVHTVKGAIERVKKLQLTISDFEILEVIGRGAFGEVKAS